MALSKIGKNHGSEGSRQILNADNPGKVAFNNLLGEPGKVYPESTIAAEGTVRKLIEGHNDYVDFKQVMESRPF